MIGPLSNQCALVTGASSGIGAAIAVAFAAAGAKVGLNYRAGSRSAQDLIRKIQNEGGEAAAIEADVAREPDVRAMFAAVQRAFGRVDILVANAGIQRDAFITEMELDAWERVLSVNLTGQFLCAREAVRHFLAQGPTPHSRALGKVICIGSVHDVIPWAGHINYAASKGGVMMMMKSLAQEVAEKKIRVNAISPGAIKTRINRDAWSDAAAAEALLKLIPYGRIGEPEDVAKAAVWLASDDSDYVTGATLYVDGGMTLYPEFRHGG